MALVVAGVGAGVSPLPATATSQTVCNQDDFEIPDSEPADSNARSLLAGTSEVGTETVSATSGDEILHVEMVDSGNNGQLNWSVHYEDDDGDCVAHDPADCDDAIRSDNTEQTCTLDAPTVGTREYHVKFAAGNQNQIKYKTWVG